MGKKSSKKKESKSLRENLALIILRSCDVSFKLSIAYINKISEAKPDLSEEEARKYIDTLVFTASRTIADQVLNYLDKEKIISYQSGAIANFLRGEDEVVLDVPEKNLVWD